MMLRIFPRPFILLILGWVRSVSRNLAAGDGALVESYLPLLNLLGVVRADFDIVSIGVLLLLKPIGYIHL